MIEENDLLIKREFYSDELADLIQRYSDSPYYACLIRILTGDIICARYGTDYYMGCEECSKYYKGCYVEDMDFIK